MCFHQGLCHCKIRNKENESNNSDYYSATYVISIALSYGVEMMLLCWLRNVVNSVFALEEVVIWSPFDHVIASMSITLVLSGLNSCTVIMYINRLLVKEN